MKRELKDLKKGQIIELRWEYWSHDMDEFAPRTLHMLLLERSTTPGWRAKVFYDSCPKEQYEKNVPYINIYYDTWLKLSMEQHKLTILWTPENEV